MTAADTANAVGSGSLPVLGTPRLLAWLEATTCAVIDPALPEEYERGHAGGPRAPRADPVGGRVTCSAVVTGQTSRAVTFAVMARDDRGADVARGTIIRVVVDSARFLGRLS